MRRDPVGLLVWMVGRVLVAQLLQVGVRQLAGGLVLVRLVVARIGARVDVGHIHQFDLVGLGRGDGVLVVRVVEIVLEVVVLRLVLEIVERAAVGVVDVLQRVLVEGLGIEVGLVHGLVVLGVADGLGHVQHVGHVLEGRELVGVLVEVRLVEDLGDVLIFHFGFGGIGCGRPWHHSWFDANNGSAGQESTPRRGFRSGRAGRGRGKVGVEGARLRRAARGDRPAPRS